jgi:hypothetical protein
MGLNLLLASRAFGKFLANHCFGGLPWKGKSVNSRVFIGELMVGLGGLEPPTSPLSELRSLVTKPPALGF